MLPTKVLNFALLIMMVSLLMGFNGSAVAETAFQAALLYHKGSPKDGFRIYISFCTDGLAGYLLHL